VIALYITSISEDAGKTMLAAGLGKSLAAGGKKIGYFKPLISDTHVEEERCRKDASFMKQVLALKETVEDISPVINAGGELGSLIQPAYSKVTQGKDIVIIEGLPLNTSSPVIEALDARVLIVHDYAAELIPSMVDYRKMGNRLAGIVINKVPKGRMEAARAEAENVLSPSGLVVLGMIPEDRALMTLTVVELTEALQGKILNNTEKSSELVENIMLGAMTFDSGIDYFARKNNKAVILKGDRPDMQMAALQTSTRCLILSGGAQPLPVVARQAGLKKVPVISVPGNVPSIIGEMEKALVNVRFNQEKKMPGLLGLIKQNINLKQFSQNSGAA
jgi:uncharacterized protein